MAIYTKQKQVERKVIGLQRYRVQLNPSEVQELKQSIYRDVLENEVYSNNNLYTNSKRHFEAIAQRIWGKQQAINFYLEESTTWHSYLLADEPIYEEVV